MWDNCRLDRFAPGANIGLLGGGQLGRMFAMAARNLGYRVHVFSSEKDSPASAVADSETVGDFRDECAIRKFATQIDVATFEFEHLPHETACWIEETVPVRPDPSILRICQNRAREKEFLVAHGFPITPFVKIESDRTDWQRPGFFELPAILKTADGGYDGKGQQYVRTPADLEDAIATHPGRDMVLEKVVDLAMELSVIVARSLDGTVAHWGVIANRHRHHILDVSVAPAEVAPDLADEAVAIAGEIARELNLVGVICVEFFLDSRGRLMVNELAPRPHNSGHLTIEASPTSQFEQQARAICGLPLGSTEIVRPAAMANLLGDLWRDGEPHFERIGGGRDIRLHLYGKKEARPGRKMGHLTALARTAAEALHRVCDARNVIRASQDEACRSHLPEARESLIAMN